MVRIVFLCVLFFFQRLLAVYSERSYPYDSSTTNVPISHTVLFLYSACPFKEVDVVFARHKTDDRLSTVTHIAMHRGTYDITLSITIYV